MLLALYHHCCPVVRVWLSIRSPPALLRHRLDWVRERESGKAEENEGKEAEGISRLHKLLWSCVSVEGTNERRGLPNKRRHLQQLSQLTGKLWRFANVGWQQGNLNNEACGRKERGMRRWRGCGGTEEERCVALMKQVLGSPSPLSAGIIERLSACFSQANSHLM